MNTEVLVAIVGIGGVFAGGMIGMGTSWLTFKWQKKENKKEREVQLKKEEYFRLQEKAENIFLGGKEADDMIRCIANFLKVECCTDEHIPKGDKTIMPKVLYTLSVYFPLLRGEYEQMGEIYEELKGVIFQESQKEIIEEMICYTLNSNKEDCYTKLEEYAKRQKEFIQKVEKELEQKREEILS